MAFLADFQCVLVTNLNPRDKTENVNPWGRRFEEKAFRVPQHAVLAHQGFRELSPSSGFLQARGRSAWRKLRLEWGMHNKKACMWVLTRAHQSVFTLISMFKALQSPSSPVSIPDNVPCYKVDFPGKAASKGQRRLSLRIISSILHMCWFNIKYI